ncbi:MAG: hypothetical protein ABFD60_01390 [Bryobacteraceae bacterium]
MKAWIRTCQECGHKQVARCPAETKGDRWRDAKCKRCKSPALDYGSEMEVNERGVITALPQPTEENN